MNSPLNKEIFSETGCINREMLLRYRDNKLRDSEKHEVEKHLVDCNLCSEALEGLALVAGAASFNEVNERLANLTSQSSTFSFTRYLAVAASVAAILTLTYFAYMQFNDVNVERLAAGETALEDTIVPEPMPEMVQQQQALPAQETNPKPKINLPAEVASQSAVTSVEERQAEVAAGVTATDEVAVAEPVIAADEPPAPAAALQKESAVDQEAVFSNSGALDSKGYVSNVTYVGNRKVIDYTDAGKDKPQVASKPEKSIPSKYENREKKAEAERDAVLSEAETKRKVEYLHLLAEPIGLYNDGQYESAVKEFDELLAINPGDENARFYKGMSLYHLKRYDAALGLLKPLSAINTQPFSEEALFYTGKSYAAKGEHEQAISIFRSVVAKGGFYAEKARAELKKLQ